MEEARTNIERAVRRETGGAVARPSTEPEYVGQIAVQCVLCLALHVRDEFLRDRLVVEFHASWFITVERLDERLGAVVVPGFEVRVRFSVVFHHQSGISNVVPVVRVVYLGEAAFPLAAAGQTYPTR